MKPRAAERSWTHGASEAPVAPTTVDHLRRRSEVRSACPISVSNTHVIGRREASSYPGALGGVFQPKHVSGAAKPGCWPRREPASPSSEGG